MPAPFFYIINKNGEEVFSWNATNPTARCLGTITFRNDVVYAYSASTCELYAVSVPSGESLWTVTDLCPDSGPGRVATPVTWLKNDTVMLLTLGRRIYTVQASNGTVLMNYGPVVVPALLMPPVPSRVDDHFLFHGGDNTAFKLDVETGQVVWSAQLATQAVYTDVPAPPAVDVDGSSYIATYQGIVYKLNADGAVVWSTEPTLALAATQSAPVLVNATHVLVTSGYSKARFFLVRKSDGELTQIYADQEDELLENRVLSQLYWNNNVLYAVTSRAEIVAWDTSDLTQLKRLWIQTASSLLGSNLGGGPSIAKDGTIFVASASGSLSASLMAFGCSSGYRVSQNGLDCLCDFGSELSLEVCRPCPENQISNDATNATCQVCSAGTVPNEDQSGCSPCPDDTFSNQGDVSCKPCSEEPTNAQCYVPLAPVPVPVAAPVAGPTRSPNSNLTSAASVVLAPVAVLFLAIAL